MRAILLAKATITSMRGLRASMRASQDPGGAPHHGACPDDQQAPYRPLAHLRGRAKPLFAARGFLQRREPHPGSEVPSFAEAFCRGRQRDDRRGCDQTDARDGRQAPGDLIFLGAFDDLYVKLGDLIVQVLERGDAADPRTRFVQ